MTKRVAIIGAGASGLTCIKCCLDEDLEPVCFERTDDIGGLWNFQEKITDGSPGIYKSLIINTSKEMMCYSDCPIPDDYPSYMHNSRILEYFRLYAKHFNLVKYIRFKTNVCSIAKRADFSSTGQWDVVTRDAEDNRESAIFDAILICTGHHANPHLPLDSFPGIEKFNGQYMHSKEYKEPLRFEGKRVVVIGIGNSGSDLAVEISRHAKQVFLSTRRGAWIVNRVAAKGFPADMLFNCRINCLLPSSLKTWFAERAVNSRLDHANYGLQPSHSFFSQHPTVNDDLPNRIISGTVLVKPNVKQFTETAAIFEDGTVEDIDVVVFATGYTFSFPFLDESIIKVHKNHVSLHKYVFLPQLEQPTLAIIGLIQPLGAIMPISELQARWATRVFKGLAKLPSVSTMMAEILEKKEKMAKRYVGSQRHTIQVDYVLYMDELAELIGVKPNIKQLLLSDPLLAFHVFFGPCSPYQFRLTGPGKWPKARETILTQWERTIKPTKTRVVTDNQKGTSLPVLLKLLALLVALGAVYLFL
ncbi:flavin-containing monooxygenase 5-like [Heptranchias perlo]|uniref:flavin-containing monooxygenase 5-like n=1 Tax=Heptranchias perlo TaxID=212740 RepID=UPI00355A2E23